MSNEFSFFDLRNMIEDVDQPFSVWCARIDTDSDPVKSYSWYRDVIGYDALVNYLKFALAENIPISVRYEKHSNEYMILVG